MLSYFFRQTFRNLVRSKQTAFQTLFMMLVSLFLLGSFFWSSRQVERMLKRWEGEAPILVYLKEDLKKNQIDELIDEIKDHPAVSVARKISPEMALSRLGKNLGKQKNLLQGVQSLLFPVSVEVDLLAEYRNPKNIVAWVKKFQNNPHIQQIDYGREWFLPLWKISNWLQNILWASGLFVLLAISLMSAGTVRLSIVLHHKEISVMRMVGATESFVRIPYYLEGFLSGLIASILAWTLLWFGFIALQSSFGSEFENFASIPLAFFSVQDSMLFLLSGAIAGMFGSWWVFRVHKGTR